MFIKWLVYKQLQTQMRVIFILPQKRMNGNYIYHLSIVFGKYYVSETNVNKLPFCFIVVVKIEAIKNITEEKIIVDYRQYKNIDI